MSREDARIYPVIKTDFKKQGVELPGTRPANGGGTGIYRNAAFSNELVATNNRFIHTLYEGFNFGLKVNPDGPCAGHREFNAATQVWSDFIWETYSEIDKRRTNFGSGMLYIYDTIVKGQKSSQWPVGIYANNRPEWLIVDQANHAYSLITVALYDTLGPDAAEFCIQLTEIPIVVTSIEHVPTMLKLAAEKKIPSMKALIVMESLKLDGLPTPPGELPRGSLIKSWGTQVGIQVFDFNEVEELGKKYLRPHYPPKPNDLTSICFTSGTSGTPKGAMLSHGNMVAAQQASAICLEYTPGDTLISYLPLAHIYGRIAEAGALHNGAGIGYFRGDILGLLDDIALLKPTHFPSVPRLLNRIAARIKAATVEAPGIIGALSRRAVAAKTEKLLSGGGYEHPLWDRLVFRKVKAVLGGRVRMIVTGAAPISPQVLTFLRVVLCCQIVEGYGQTEGGATTSLQVPNEFIAGHCGPPVVCTEIKLIDVTEMGFTAKDKPYPRGELLYRGYNTFLGYYKDEIKTRETIDEEGWIHTGDVAQVDETGCFKIVDRTKNLIKMEQGEYVAVEKVENTYTSFGLISQIYVHGESLYNFLVAIIVPDPEVLSGYLDKRFGVKIGPTDIVGLEKACKEERVLKAVLKNMDKVAETQGLQGFERVKKIYLTMEPFTIETILTPTLKVKRNIAREYFKKAIEEMYRVGIENKAKL